MVSDHSETGWTLTVECSEVDVLECQDDRPSFANDHRRAPDEIRTVEHVAIGALFLDYVMGCNDKGTASVRKLAPEVLFYTKEDSIGCRPIFDYCSFVGVL